jgi:hypothetical protein
VVSPRRHVKVDPTRGEVGAVTIVDHLAQPVVKPLGGRHTPGSFAGLPDAEVPDEVEPVACKLVKLRIRYVVQGRGMPERAGEFRKANTGVDLEK